MSKIKLLITLCLCAVFVFSFSACSDLSEEEITPVNLTELIETSILQYPSTNDSFRYNKYDNFVEITECLTAESIVEIPDEIEKLPVIGIRENAFEQNKTITKLIISDNVLFIRELAFSGCENLKEVRMSKNLIEIGESTFLDCILLREISLPASLKSVPTYCFSGCTNLEKVFIDGSSDPAILDEEAEGYRSITSEAFSNCPYLKHVWIANDMSYIDEGAFAESTEYLTIYSYAASPSAKFAADNLIDFEEKDKNTFHNTMLVSSSINIPHYKTFGEPISSSNWKIELLDYKEYKAINSFKAPNGKVYLAVTFKITNYNNQTQYFNYLDTIATVSGYKKYPIFLNTPKINDNNFLSFELAPNATKTGYLLYEVNENWKYIAIDFENCAGFGDKGNIETCLMIEH